MTTPFSSPHAHGARSVGKVMALVMLALAPATALGFWNFGWPAVYLWALTIASCIFADALCVRMAGRPGIPAVLDGSAVLTGWLLAMSLPPWAPWWIGAAGGAFAIVVAKHVFGGLGQNLFNPAMAARVMLLISFPIEMTQWLTPASSAQMPGMLQGLAVTFGGGVPDAMTSASLLGYVKTEATKGVLVPQALDQVFGVWSSFLGERSGSLGETSALLLLAGGVFLMLQRIINARIPVAYLLGVGLPALLASTLSPDHYLPPLAHLLAGGTMLAAFFIATDYVTSPSTPLGQWIFGLGCGLLTWIIRTWGAYPEGVAFAVMIMNAATPLIDHYTRPRIFGRRRNGRSIAPAANR